jgi:hypothetical protein
MRRDNPQEKKTLLEKEDHMDVWNEFFLIAVHSPYATENDVHTHGEYLSKMDNNGER